MKTNLTRIGESVALLLDEPLLEQAGLREDDEVEVSASATGLTVTPSRERKLEQLLDEMDEQYGSVFRRLAE